MSKPVTSGTRLKPGAFYRITSTGADPSPSLQVGDVVHCEEEARRAIHPDPVDDLWFADYQGDGEGFGTIVVGLEEVEGALA